MRMQSLCVVLLLLFLSIEGFSQIEDPVNWTFQSQQVADGQYDLLYQATIDEGWSVYSQNLERDDGPIATSITFDEGAHFELVGQSQEDERGIKAGYDSIFEMNVRKYQQEMTITQRVRILDYSQPVTGYLTYMTCDDTRCLPPEEVNFTFTIAPESTREPDTNSAEDKDSPKANHVAQRVPIQQSDDSTTQDPIKVAVDSTSKSLISPEYSTVSSEGLYPVKSMTQLARNDCDSEGEPIHAQEGKSIVAIFILGMLGGFLALLTPCVFPLIPLTVSFFTKSGSSSQKKGTRDALFYGFFILLVYMLLSIPFHVLDTINPDILNDISTNVWLNVAFFIVFIVFAISFFGYFDIVLPAGLTNKVSNAEGVGGVIGIFFMALTLSIVSFSCTGPILGSLLAGALSSDGGAWQLSAGMSGFGLALALPFTLLAMFPRWINRLPKSGGWLNRVKVVLGFLEIALALKFLSNADLVMHWGVLKYELFMILWILLALSTALYLFGIIRFPHDSRQQHLSKSRVALGIAMTALTIYLAFGLRVNPSTQGFNSLKLLSGIAPPAGYSWLYPSDCPHNINCYKELEEGLKYAQEVRKPVLLDFTGYACVNCRKMEEHVWSDQRVFDLINDEYVLISLYVDDKKELPEHEQVEVERVQGGKRMLRNYGHKWAHFQTQFFQTNSQPYYVLLSADGETMLSQPVGYTPNIDEYVRFLKCGLAVFNKEF